MPVELDRIEKITDYLFEIPQSYRQDMRVPARIYATAAMLSDIARDRSLDQLVNVATLPGITEAALAMPDVHEGYGFPVGGVAATEYPDGIISPGGIGYDINCGVRLLTTKLTANQFEPHKTKIARQLYRLIPSGVGHGGQLKLSPEDFIGIFTQGVDWMVRQGYGLKEDLDHLESSGKIMGADPQAVSAIAQKRGRDQLGTMGAGNHFVEIDRVEKIISPPLAEKMKLFPDQIVILIHTGSRGLGHQVATDYIRIMLKNLAKYSIELPDRELAGVPFSSPEGQQYFAAMAAAANFAFSNRQLIAHQIRQVWQEVFQETPQILYDVAHNIAKIETHTLANGQEKQLIVHRKGATRAFPDQPVLIPGSMGTASYVLMGTPEAMKQSFGSCCHGAGRRMSRSQAKREVSGQTLKEELEKRGIVIESGSMSGLAEEAPLAYKDVDLVVEVVEKAGLSQRVVRLAPLAVIKG